MIPRSQTHPSEPRPNRPHSCTRSQTKSIKYLEENFAANDVVLSQAEMDEIRKVIQENPIQGAQYNEKLQALMDEN